MRPVACAVCHLLIVVSNCRPGSAHSHAAVAIWRHRSRARTVLMTATVGDGDEVPVGVVDDGLHELVGDAHRVVRVLVLDAERVGAVEIHVEAGVAQHASLLLFLALAPDELFDVGVIGVEDDHLRRAAGLAAALDGAGRCIGAAHEADRTAGRATTLQQLVAGADLGQVDARTRSRP